VTSHRHISFFLGSSALIALALTTVACGGSSPSSSSTTHPPAATSPAAGASGNAVAEITTNWEAFFSAQTPVSQRVSLLQDGSQFQQIIQSQAGSGLASQASAKVTKVTVTSPTQATVKYDILLDGTPALTNQTGTAVLDNGTWKVGVTSFCGLLTLENGGKATGLPAACQTG
jgi:ABC-type glycerol-3-phosphate transport system substrate-binding protein